MKTTILWLTTELDNCGTETTLFASEAQLELAMDELLWARLDHIEEYCQAENGWRTLLERAALVKEKMTAGDRDGAWEIYRGDDGKEPVQDQDDYYFWGQQEIELSEEA